MSEKRQVGVLLRSPDRRFKLAVVSSNGKGVFTVLDSEPLGDDIEIGDMVRFTPDGTYATALVFTDDTDMLGEG